MALAPTPGERQEDIKAMTREQLSRFLVGPQGKEPRHYLTLFTMARTGIRLGEAFGLQWDDLDCDGRKIAVRRGISSGRVESPKNRKGRTVI